MLFYLQEERRKNALSSSQARKELTVDGFIGSFEVIKDQQARVSETLCVSAMLTKNHTWTTKETDKTPLAVLALALQFWLEDHDFARRCEHGHWVLKLYCIGPIATFHQMMSSKMGVMDDRGGQGVDHRSFYIPTAPSMSSRATMRTIGTVVPQLWKRRKLQFTRLRILSSRQISAYWRFSRLQTKDKHKKNPCNQKLVIFSC